MKSSYKAEQVGSLLRPKELIEARNQVATGQLAADELRAVEDRAIQRVLQRQVEVGLDVLTDGEFRRSSFMSPLMEAVDGFVTLPAKLLDWQGRQGEAERHNELVVSERIVQKRRLLADEAAFMLRHAPRAFKITVPSPMIYATSCYRKAVSGVVYPALSDLTRELATIVSAEIGALVREGVKYIQLDAPNYTHFADPRRRVILEAEGIDLDTAFEDAIAADNTCLQAARAQDVTVGVHLCRGNSRSRWLAEGSYDPIAEKLFSGLQVDRFLLEYDSERAGGFEPLRFMPRGKTVVLGLITSKFPMALWATTDG